MDFDSVQTFSDEGAIAVPPSDRKDYIDSALDKEHNNR
jgi:hypothetical protein